MLERLLENWLDSASERSYQTAFCQMLSADGYRILHSTRHHQVEFGKDVIAIAPDGVPCAYQLKGNPGTRLTLSGFREIQKQLWQLATQAIVFPGVPHTMHRSYLVTNGYVEEDVQKSIDEMNTQFAKGQVPQPRIEIIQRGQLVDMANKLGSRLWPTGNKDVGVLIRLLGHDGRDQLPLEPFHQLLVGALPLNADSKKPSIAEAKRNITSTALLVATALTEFSRANNHYAVLTAWTMFCTYAIAVCSRFEFDFEKTARDAVDIANGAILDSVCNLCDEADGKKYPIEGDPFTDFIAYRWRQCLLRGLFALLWFWLTSEEGEDAERRRSAIARFMANNEGKTQLWGEAAVPQVLIRVWHLRITNQAAGLLEIAGLLAFITQVNLGRSQIEPLANPYYGYEDVVRHLAHDILMTKDDVLQFESFRTTSFFALPLFQLLAAHGAKQACQAMWPDMTRLNHKKFIPDAAWKYCLLHTEGGIEQSVQLPAEKTWTAVESEARETQCEEVPAELREYPLLLMIFTIIAPHRATPNVIRVLDRVFQPTFKAPTHEVLPA